MSWKLGADVERFVERLRQWVGEEAVCQNTEVLGQVQMAVVYCADRVGGSSGGYCRFAVNIIETSLFKKLNTN